MSAGLERTIEVDCPRCHRNWPQAIIMIFKTTVPTRFINSEITVEIICPKCKKPFYVDLPLRVHTQRDGAPVILESLNSEHYLISTEKAQKVLPR